MSGYCDIGKHLHSVTSLRCSGLRSSLECLEGDVKIIVLAEISLSLSNLNCNLEICEGHKEFIIENVSKRNRRTRCGIGEIQSSLQFHDTEKKAERHVTAELCARIQQVAGVVIPVGTRKQFPWDSIVLGKVTTTPLRMLFDDNGRVTAEIMDSDSDN
ncbi:uncharacterized protein LOC134265979, partial [Saccostrea cucullata]|uniref:uncharacterized protein LOC134265979 n=1 Tax=Saccostrea cuccullata TaxID=36930 RepID=UPI002ED54F8A